MRAHRAFVPVLALLFMAVLSFLPRAAHAQLFGGPGYVTQTILGDTCAIAMMDSSGIVDMSQYRYASLRVKVVPPAGAAEPWATVALRFIACTSANPDSNATSIMQLQPIADHSYVGAAAGDSLGYGAWATANGITAGNGEVIIHSQRPNSKWPYPGNAWTFSIDNKGQLPRTRYWYVQSRVIAAGGDGATRVSIVVTRSN